MRRGTLVLLSAGCGLWLVLCLHAAAYFMGVSPPQFFQTLGAFFGGTLFTALVFGFIAGSES